MSGLKRRVSGRFPWHEACGEADMKRFFVSAALATATIWTAVPPAQAEFFSLDGRFQSLESGAKPCGDAQILVKPLPAPAPAPASASPEPAMPDPVSAL